MQEDPVLEALWKRVLERWDDRSPHDTFLSACHEREMLGYAAARYRAVAEGHERADGDDEARREQARKRLGAVTMLAMQALEATRQPAKPKTPRWLVVLVALSTASAFAWLAWVLSR